MAIFDHAHVPTWALLIVLSTVPLAAQEGGRALVKTRAVDAVADLEVLRVAVLRGPQGR